MISEPRKDPDVKLRVHGLDGGFQGHERVLEIGEALVVGRSRGCDFFPQIKEGGITTQAEVVRLRRMSRRHCKVSFCSPDHIEVEDLSRNGTIVDGRRVDRLILRDLHLRAATIDIAGLRLMLELERTD